MERDAATEITPAQLTHETGSKLPRIASPESTPVPYPNIGTGHPFSEAEPTNNPWLAHSVSTRVCASIYRPAEHNKHVCLLQSESKCPKQGRALREEKIPRPISLLASGHGQYPLGGEDPAQQKTLLPGWTTLGPIVVRGPPHPLGEGGPPRDKLKSQLPLQKSLGAQKGSRPPKRCPFQLCHDHKWPENHGPSMATSRFQVSCLKNPKAEASRGTAPYSPSIWRRRGCSLNQIVKCGMASRARQS